MGQPGKILQGCTESLLRAVSASRRNLPTLATPAGRARGNPSSRKGGETLPSGGPPHAGGSVGDRRTRPEGRPTGATGDDVAVRTDRAATIDTDRVRVTGARPGPASHRRRRRP